jgi:hypothetical protein
MDRQERLAGIHNLLAPNQAMDAPTPDYQIGEDTYEDLCYRIPHLAFRMFSDYWIETPTDTSLASAPARLSKAEFDEKMRSINEDSTGKRRKAEYKTGITFPIPTQNGITKVTISTSEYAKDSQWPKGMYKGLIIDIDEQPHTFEMSTDMSVHAISKTEIPYTERFPGSYPSYERRLTAFEAEYLIHLFAFVKAGVRNGSIKPEFLGRKKSQIKPEEKDDTTKMRELAILLGHAEPESYEELLMVAETNRGIPEANAYLSRLAKMPPQDFWPK